MKVEIEETNHAFSFRFTAETLTEAALITSWGLNRKKEITDAGATFHRTGDFTGWLTVGRVASPTQWLVK